MKNWIQSYVDAQRRALESVPVDQIAAFVETLKKAHNENRQIFVIGNGGSACNASHFAVDLGKGASDALGKRFRVLSLTDNVGWITAWAMITAMRTCLSVSSRITAVRGMC